LFVATRNSVRQRTGRQSPQQWRKRPCKCVSATHGGLTPAAPGAACDDAVWTWA